MTKPKKTDDLELKALTDKLEKEFGKNILIRLDDDTSPKVDVISTGSISLDIALKIRGLPRGRVVEIYGPESSGKTTLSLHCIAEANKLGELCGFIDVEHALDKEYSKALGVDPSLLFVSQPDCGEQALEVAEQLIRSNKFAVVVVDSVAALSPRAEIEGNLDKTQVGAQARMMSQYMRKITNALNKSKTILIFINQLRDKIGVMFGNPETTSGGKALRYYSSVRLDIRRIGSINTGPKSFGNRTRVKVVKNKLAAPFEVCEFDIVFGKGISRTGEVLDFAVDLNLIDKSGSWYSHGDDRIGQGREAVKQYLDEHPDFTEALVAAIYESYQ